MPRFSKFEIKLIKEAAIFIAADKRTKRIMIEGCGDPDPAAEQIKIDSVDMYPEEHTSHDGRMMDYGHKKSDSHEGRMTKAKLFRLAQMAQRLHDKMVDEDDLPEWVQDKVTTAEDRLKSAHDYITYKIHRLEENNKIRGKKMKITKRQLKRIIREEKARILEEARSFDQAEDHYVGGVRMTGPGADNVFGSRKRDDRSIENKIMGMSAEQHRELIHFIIEKAQYTLKREGLEKAIAEAMAKLR